MLLLVPLVTSVVGGIVGEELTYIHFGVLVFFFLQ